MAAPLRISVVVPTHNRAARLLPLLAALRDEIGRHGAAQLIVVDSASTDDTAAIAEREAAAHRFQVVRASQPGATLARNRGVAAARAPLVVFIDDDVMPRPGFLAALEAVHRDESVHAAGGRIVLAPEAELPSWLAPAFRSYLAEFDLGDAPRDLTRDCVELSPRTAIMSVRRDVFARLGGFSELFGPRGTTPIVGDEPELCRRIVAAGGRIVYVPDAVVDHFLPAARLTREAMARRFFYQGVTEAFAAIRFDGAGSAWARLARGVRRRVEGNAWDRPGNADHNQVLAHCRRRQSLGYAAGVVLGTLRYRVLRADVQHGSWLASSG